MEQQGNAILSRIALSVGEHRRDLDLSRRALERASGVSRTTIARIESHRPVRLDLVVRVAAALMVIDTFRPPELSLDVELAERIAAPSPTRLVGEGWWAS